MKNESLAENRWLPLAKLRDFGASKMVNFGDLATKHGALIRGSV
jgi:hypothetical protein